MAASDLQAASAAKRQRLLRELFTSPASETFRECRDSKVLDAVVQDATQDLVHASFVSVNPRHVSTKSAGVTSLLSRHAQTTKLAAFIKLKAEYVSRSLLPITMPICSMTLLSP
jgi:hypothetical protein